MNLLLDAPRMVCPSLQDTLPIGLVIPDADPYRVFLSQNDLRPDDFVELRSDRILGRLMLWHRRCWRIIGVQYCPHLHGRFLLCCEMDIAIHEDLGAPNSLRLV